MARSLVYLLLRRAALVLLLLVLSLRGQDLSEQSRALGVGLARAKAPLAPETKRPNPRAVRSAGGGGARQPREPLKKRDERSDKGSGD